MCSRVAQAVIAARALGALAAVLTLVFGPSALAAPDARGVEIDRVVYGFSNLMPTETWAPLTVWLRAGEKGFSGTLVVKYGQDATQSAQIVVPAAATPGTSVPVQAIVCLPLHAQRIELTVFDQEGRKAAAGEYGSFQNGAMSQWEATIEPGGSGVVQLGDMSLQSVLPGRDAVAAPGVDLRPLGYGLPAEKNYLELLRCVRTTEALPFHWSAYTGLSLLAVRAEEAERQDPRVLEAVGRWVSAGGRILIVATRPGTAWRRWLPPGEANDPIEILDMRRERTPPSLREVIESTREFAKPSTGGQFAGPEQRVDAAQAAPDLLARPLTLTAVGREHGWRLRHLVENPSAGAELGLIAEGPVGFGWVVVVGFEPELAAAVAEKAATTVVWEDALHEALQAFAGVRSGEESAQYPTFYYGNEGSSSAPTRPSQRALGNTLDSICRASPPRITFFLVISVCLLAFAALVGPIDRLVLRRMNLPQLACLTAIGWTLLASGAAAIAPFLLRSDRTTLSRARVIDSLQIASGSDRALAWRTGATAIFADSRETYRFEGADASSWWRGVGASWWFGHTQSRGFSPLTCSQSLPSVGTMPPGNVPGPLAQGQWTLRCFQDDGPELRVVRATFARDSKGPFVRVQGIPAGATLFESALKAKSGSTPMVAAGQSQADGWVLRVHPQFKSLSALPVWKKQPVEGLFLPELRERAIDARIDSGAWACLYIAVQEQQTDVGISVPAAQSMNTIYRLLLPYRGELEESGS